MDAYLERIARALETIAGRQTSPVNTEENVKTEKSVGLDMTMPGSDSPAVEKKAVRKPRETAPLAAPVEVDPKKPILMTDVADVIRRYVLKDEKDGKANSISVLAKFGVKKISELKSEDFPAAIKKFNELLNAQK